jgi:hypothetical protein
MPDDDDIRKIIPDELSSKRDETIAALETRLEKERDARKEERFYSVVGMVILFNFVTFPSMQTWGAPIALLILEILLLLGFAKQCGVDYVVKLIDRTIGDVVSRTKKD